MNLSGVKLSPFWSEADLNNRSDGSETAVLSPQYPKNLSTRAWLPLANEQGYSRQGPSDFRSLASAVNPDVAARIQPAEILSYFGDDGGLSTTIALRGGVGRVSNGPTSEW